MPQLKELTTSRLDLAPLAAAIERVRREQGLSLRQAAAHLGLTPSTLTRVRQGKRPDAEALAVLVAWSGVPIQALLRPDDPARRPSPAPERTLQRSPARRRGPLLASSLGDR